MDVLVGGVSLDLPSFVYGYDNDAIGYVAAILQQSLLALGALHVAAVLRLQEPPLSPLNIVNE